MTTPIGFLARETCLLCGATALTQVPDFSVSKVQCDCCPKDHDHNAAASSCDGSHEEDHGAEVAACAVCRPVRIEILSLGEPLTTAG